MDAAAPRMRVQQLAAVRVGLVARRVRLPRPRAVEVDAGGADVACRRCRALRPRSRDERLDDLARAAPAPASRYRPTLAGTTIVSA